MYSGNMCQADLEQVGKVNLGHNRRQLEVNHARIVLPSLCKRSWDPSPSPSTLSRDENRPVKTSSIKTWT